MRSNQVNKLWIFLRSAALVLLVSLLLANGFGQHPAGDSFPGSLALAQKADSKKTGSSKKETNKKNSKKADVSSSQTSQSGSKKGSTKKPATSKAANKKGDTKKPETPQAGSRKGSSQKPKTSKPDTKSETAKQSGPPTEDLSTPADVPTGTTRVNSGRLAALTIFVLAVFVGFEVITKVPPTLHTPLMSGSNAISGITIVGAMIVAGHEFWHSHWLGMMAIALATVNVVGGFLVTHRMLAMFRKR